MAARFCPQCGQEVSSTARFCPNCAAPLMAAASPIAPSGGEITRMDVATDKTRRLLLPALVVALVVLIITVAVLAGKPRQPIIAAQSPPAPAVPLLSAPTVPAAPPLVSAPTTSIAPAPPLTNAPTDAPSKLPPDVAAYVAFLQGLDTRRVALANDTSGASAMMQSAQQMQTDQGDPDQHNQSVPGNVSKINAGFTDYVGKWQTLVRDFGKQSPPPSCALLANQYGLFLGGYADTISKLQVALLNHDYAGALTMQAAQQQLNAQAEQADVQLANLCTRYNAPKPFAIRPDGASSSVVGG